MDKVGFRDPAPVHGMAACDQEELQLKLIALALFYFPTKINFPINHFICLEEK
jgi:hypothetical protein